MPHKTHSNRGGNAKLVPFLRKLQEFVTTVVPKDVGGWNETGTRFLVYNMKAFEDLVKQHFQWTSAQTFNRQLNLYDFTKEDTPHWSFGHPRFLRDEPSKIVEIKRYARASDKEEPEVPTDEQSSSRVQFLESKISELQHLVDDLSVKLAKVQLVLNQSSGSANDVTDEAMAEVEKHTNEHGKYQDEEVAESSHLLEDDDIDAEFGSSLMASPTTSDGFPDLEMETEPLDRETRAQDFFSSLLTTREFQAVMSSALRKQPSFSAGALIQEEVSL